MSERILKQILLEIQGMKSEMQEMKSEMNSRFDTLETSVGTVELKVDIINNHVANTSEQLNSISNKQSKQGKILESLSLRSLEQEADIRVLKRI